MKYTVEFDITPALMGSRNIFDDFNAMNDWCKENLTAGYNGGQYSLKTRTGIFIFELEADAMAFKLRWL